MHNSQCTIAVDFSTLLYEKSLIYILKIKRQSLWLRISHALLFFINSQFFRNANGEKISFIVHCELKNSISFSELSALF